MGCVLACVAQLAAQVPPPRVTGAADDGIAPFGATDPLRVRLPEQDWRAGSDSTLPPPPGWVAAEFASLSPTMGSSPESEPLDPSDELTMDTGRIASHKDGFFQKLSLTAGWLNRDGLEDFGMVEARSFRDRRRSAPFARLPAADHRRVRRHAAGRSDFARLAARGVRRLCGLHVVAQALRPLARHPGA